MNIAATIEMFFGGPGSGCRGPNCGRKSGGRVSWEVPSAYRRWMNKYGVDFKMLSKKDVRPTESFDVRNLDRKQLVKLYKKSQVRGEPLMPVLAQKRHGKYEVYDGHHRATLAFRLGDKQVGAFVVHHDRDHEAYNQVGASNI